MFSLLGAMVYYSTSRYSGRGYRSGGFYRRRGKFAYSRNGRYRSAKKWSGTASRSSRSGKRSTMSSLAVARKLQQLEMQSLYGPKHTLQLGLAMPASFFSGGPYLGRNYFVVPVSEVLRAALRLASVSMGYLRGVSFEFDVVHAADVDFQISCFTRPVGLGSDLNFFQLDRDPPVFSLAVSRTEDEKGYLMSLNAPEVTQLANGLFDGPAPDGSLFGASVRSSVEGCVRNWSVKRNTGGKSKPVKGRVCEVAFNKRPVSDGSVGRPVVKERARFYCDIDQRVSLEDLSSNYYLFGGIRSNCEHLVQVKDQSIFRAGAIESGRLTLYCRY